MILVSAACGYRAHNATATAVAATLHSAPWSATGAATRSATWGAAMHAAARWTARTAWSAVPSAGSAWRRPAMPASRSAMPARAAVPTVRVAAAIAAPYDDGAAIGIVSARIIIRRPGIVAWTISIVIARTRDTAGSQGKHRAAQQKPA
jgi:hypothetical protein